MWKLLLITVQNRRNRCALQNDFCGIGLEHTSSVILKQHRTAQRIHNSHECSYPLPLDLFEVTNSSHSG
jgi:hypothetical protein